MRSESILPALVLGWIGFAGALHAGTAAAVRVEDAWIRWLPAGIPAGGYLTLVNDGDRPVVLVAAESPDYGEISLHVTRNQNGMSHMVSVSNIVVAPHSRLSFAAAGYHMMLMQPTVARHPGDEVPITLRFADGGSLSVKFRVRRPDGGQ
jgi:copper(I)-binding protein